MVILLRNELFKVFHNKRVYVFLGIIALVSIGMSLIVTNISVTGQITQEMIDELSGAHFPLQVLSTMSDLLLPIFVTLIITFLIADEYEEGTLKLPILHGYNRNKVLLSKVLTGILVCFILLLFMGIFSYALGFVIWGSSVFERTVFIESVKAFGFDLIPNIGVIMMISFISLLIKNSGIVTGITIAVLVMSSLIGGMFPGISKYVVTFYLKAIASSSISISNMTAWLVCFTYIILFFIVTHTIFNRMEIQK